MANGFLFQVKNETSVQVTLNTTPGDNCFNVVPAAVGTLDPGGITMNSPLYAEVSGSCNNAVANVTIGPETQSPGNVVIAFDDDGSRFPSGSIYILSFNAPATSKGTFVLPYITLQANGQWTQATLYLIEVSQNPPSS